MAKDSGSAPKAADDKAKPQAPPTERVGPVTLLAGGAIVVIALIVSSSAISKINRYHEEARDECRGRLSAIEDAKTAFAATTNVNSGTVPSPQQLAPYVSGDVIESWCPMAKDDRMSFVASYSINDLDTDPVCNILPAEHTLADPPATDQDD